MAHMMLVNPKRKRRTKRRKSSMRRNPRRRRHSFTPAQIAAGFGGGGRRKRRRSRKAMRTNPRPHRRRRFRRNPRGGGIASLRRAPGMFLREQLMPAVIGASGALAVDIAWAYAPVPPNIKTGAFAPLVKIGGAVVMGAIVSRFVNKRFGAGIVSGYLTVTAFDFIKGMVAKALPNVTLAGGYPYDLGFYQAGQFIPGGGNMPGMGAYLPGPDHAETEGVGAYLEGWGDEVS